MNLQEWADFVAILQAIADEHGLTLTDHTNYDYTRSYQHASLSYGDSYDAPRYTVRSDGQYIICERYLPRIDGEGIAERHRFTVRKDRAAAHFARDFARKMDLAADLALVEEARARADANGAAYAAALKTALGREPHRWETATDYEHVTSFGGFDVHLPLHGDGLEPAHYNASARAHGSVEFIGGLVTLVTAGDAGRVAADKLEECGLVDLARALRAVMGQ